MRLIRDSSGKPSWSYTLAVPSLIGLTLWFISGGIEVTVGGTHILLPARSASEYAMAAGIWLAYLGHRRGKTPPNGGTTNGTTQ